MAGEETGLRTDEVRKKGDRTAEWQGRVRRERTGEGRTADIAQSTVERN